MDLLDESLADCQERYRCAFLSPRHTLSARIEHGLPIHTEQVLVVAMTQVDLHHPSPVRLALHRVRLGVPSVEIAYHRHLPRSGSVTHEIDRS
jgi:hypothetical protein